MQTYHLEQTDSTNSELRKMAAAGEATNMAMVIADYQTAGRGQVGNKWESEAGNNLLMSILLCPRCLDVRKQYYLSMAVSVGIEKALRRYVDGVKIKWPNDVYVGDKKLAGILIENTLAGVNIATSIVGIGLNVNQMMFMSDAPNPVSIKQIMGVDNDPMEIAESIRREMIVALDKVDGELYENIIADYMSILYRNDGCMHTYSEPGVGHFQAKIKEVEADGHIHLLDDSGKERVYTFKEVEFVI
ncbi:MAG: biotin--[acetyl-CoA-carboxylase] ligase [Bacteroidales bacterium]|nr:biotin--[acetyl-CoA-carboxylase] ligase [Bacteroidales bacterium]